jgi:hypothetical protein
MGRHIFPRADQELRQFTAAILNTVSANPEIYGVSPEELARQAECQQEFEHWLGIVRSPRATCIAYPRKNEARIALKSQTRRLLAIVRAQVDLPQNRLLALGLHAPRPSSPLAPPREIPRLQLIKSVGTAVEFWVRRSGIITLRRPEGAIGAMTWSWAGEYPPPDIRRQWQWAGNYHRRKVRIDFGLTRAQGGPVWIAAAWIDRKAQVGPVSPPLNVSVPGLSHAQRQPIGVAPTATRPAPASHAPAPAPRALPKAA